MDAKGGGKRSRTSGGGTTAAVERKEVERKRRYDMKALCFKLGSLVPREHRSKEAMTQFGSLGDATVYITRLKERLDELQRRRSSAMQLTSILGGAAGRGVSTPSTTMISGGAGSGQSYDAEEVPPAPAPAVEVRQHDDSSLDVTLVCSSQWPFKFHEVIVVLEEEGAEIVHANYSVAGDKIFYTIHCRAFSSRIGIEGSRVSERLKALVTLPETFTHASAVEISWRNFAISILLVVNIYKFGRRKNACMLSLQINLAVEGNFYFIPSCNVYTQPIHLGKTLSITGCDRHIQSPLSSPIEAGSGGWSALGNSKRQIIPTDEIPARNADHDMGMIPLSSSNQFRKDVSVQPSQHDSLAIQYDFEYQTQNPAWFSRSDVLLDTSVGPVGGSSDFVTGLDDAIPSGPYLRTVPEEPATGSSFSQDVEDDLLLGIDWLRNPGQAFPEHKLQASGYSSNGTTCGIPFFLC